MDTINLRSFLLQIILPPKAKLFFLLVCFGIASCKKFITVDPPTNSLTRATVFEDDETANAAIYELYVSMRNNSMNNHGLFRIAGFSSDELIYLSPDQGESPNEFYENAILPTNDMLPAFWGEYYKQIYYANSIIEGLTISTLVTQHLKDQLIAEAKFVRAYCHFYLVNLFGDIPYITGTDYELNTIAERMPADEVYDLIIQDLLEAKSELVTDYSFSGGERIRPCSYVATALLARAYLYAGDWANAEIEATYVLNNAAYRLCQNLDSVFLQNNLEAIWQFHLEQNETYTGIGDLFLNPATINYSKLSDQLIASFEAADKRKMSWTQQITVGNEVRFVPFKYKDFNGSTSDVPEYPTALRVAEQFLIRAEARAQQNKLTGANSAQSDVDVIRLRAGLNPTSASTKESLLQEISNQMRFEFFTEWGHRWLYLKHTRKADEVLQPVKVDWNPEDKLYPIPYDETLINPNMHQNPGY